MTSRVRIVRGQPTPEELAALTAIVGNGGSRPAHDHRLLPHMTTALTVVVGVSVLGLVVTAARLRPRRVPAVEAA